VIEGIYSPLPFINSNFCPFIRPIVEQLLLIDLERKLGRVLGGRTL
jgi:hypothetical protein